MAPALPLIKIFALTVRHLSKFVGKRIQKGAKTSPVLRTRVCIPLANFFHRLEVSLKMRSLNFKKPAKISDLSEAAAVEQGAEILGEAFIYTVTALVVIFEVDRYQTAKKVELEANEKRWGNLVCRLRDLEFQMDKMNAQLKSLERTLHFDSKGGKDAKQDDKNNNKPKDNDKNTSGPVAILGKN